MMRLTHICTVEVHLLKEATFPHIQISFLHFQRIFKLMGQSYPRSMRLSVYKRLAINSKMLIQ